jgi:hypothetical protein
MARFTAQVNVGENVYQTWKIPAACTDADVGKPVKLAATDRLALCVDGDQILGFISSVEGATADGYKIATILVSGRVFVKLSGASAIGTLVEAHDQQAAGTANTGNLGLVSTHTLVAGTKKQWVVISGTGDDGATVLIEKQ